MPVSVTMPRLGESVTEGTVTRWLKQEGERVEADEPLLEVSTDKVDTEIPSPAAGVLSRIVVHEDETAAVGSELAVIDGGSSDGGSSDGGSSDGGSSDGGSSDGAAVAEDSSAPADDSESGQERATVTEQRAEPEVDEPSTEKPAEAEAPKASAPA